MNSTFPKIGLPFTNGGFKTLCLVLERNLKTYLFCAKIEIGMTQQWSVLKFFMIVFQAVE